MKTFDNICWSCGSHSFIKSANLEFCPSCGIRATPNGVNDAYRKAMKQGYESERYEEDDR